MHQSENSWDACVAGLCHQISHLRPFFFNTVAFLTVIPGDPDHKYIKVPSQWTGDPPGLPKTYCWTTKFSSQQKWYFNMQKVSPLKAWVGTLWNHIDYIGTITHPPLRYELPEFYCQTHTLNIHMFEQTSLIPPPPHGFVQKLFITLYQVRTFNSFHLNER